MVGLLAIAEPIDWGRVRVATLFGAMGVWLGLRTWHGRFPGSFGPRPPYQTERRTSLRAPAQSAPPPVGTELTGRRERAAPRGRAPLVAARVMRRS